MGFQDRDYNHEPYDDYGYRRKKGGSMSMTMRIVIINFVLWFVNGLLFSGSNELTEFFVLHASALTQPARWWEFLTYGFVHSPFTFWHIGGNMLVMVMFGYGMMLGVGPGSIGIMQGDSVEGRLGRTEYLLFYLLTIIVGGIVYSVVNFGDPKTAALGASGGVTGIVILYALFFPNKVILFMFVIPMPMWVLGALIVFMDAYGAAGYGNQGIAYTIHLGGAGFALSYYYFIYRNRRRLTDMFGMFDGMKALFKRKPKLHVYREDDESKREKKTGKDVEFEKRLDEILERYGKVGESGLTSEERKFLQNASKKYRDKK